MHELAKRSESPDAGVAAPVTASRTTSPLGVVALQSAAGNAAVARLMSATPDPGRDLTAQRRLLVSSPRNRFFTPAQARALADRFLVVMNRISDANHYRLEGNVLRYALRPGVAPDPFDRRMRELVDDQAIDIPLILVRSSSRMTNPRGASRAVDVDSFAEGFVDVGDLDAESKESARMNVLHLLVERAAAPNYARRVGSSSLRSRREFGFAHRRGLAAERTYLERRLQDNTLGPAVEMRNPVRFRFSSRHGYAVMHILPTRAGGNVMAGDVVIEENSGARHTLAAWIAAHPDGFPAAPPRRGRPN